MKSVPNSCRNPGAGEGGQNRRVSMGDRPGFPARGFELSFFSDDITRPTDWTIRETRHMLIVHLGGRMDELETELDGHAGSRGAALPGEVWSIPAGRLYGSRARGGLIRYAVLLWEPGANGREILAVAGRRDARLHEMILRFSEASSATEDISEMSARSLEHAFAGYLQENYWETKEPSGKTFRPVLGRAGTRQLRDFIHDNLANPLSLEELAALACMSVHHLLAAFRDSFGQTPAQYIIGQRLRAAQRMLLKTQKDITTIALETGFSSHSHLTSTFTKWIGRSPNHFRGNLAGMSESF